MALNIYYNLRLVYINIVQDQQRVLEHIMVQTDLCFQQALVFN